MENFANWAKYGKCRGEDTGKWFLDDNKSALGRQNVKEAKAVCALCPVRIQCLNYAIENNERFGIWGGLTPHERYGRRAGLRPIRTPEMA